MVRGACFRLGGGKLFVDVEDSLRIAHGGILANGEGQRLRHNQAAPIKGATRRTSTRHRHEAVASSK